LQVLEISQLKMISSLVVYTSMDVIRKQNLFWGNRWHLNPNKGVILGNFEIKALYHALTKHRVAKNTNDSFYGILIWTSLHLK